MKPRCGTCGSDSGAMRLNVSANNCHPEKPCPDAFHDRPAECEHALPGDCPCKDEPAEPSAVERTYRAVVTCATTCADCGSVNVRNEKWLQGIIAAEREDASREQTARAEKAEAEIVKFSGLATEQAVQLRGLRAENARLREALKLIASQRPL